MKIYLGFTVLDLGFVNKIKKTLSLLKAFLVYFSMLFCSNSLNEP